MMHTRPDLLFVVLDQLGFALDWCVDGVVAKVEEERFVGTVKTGKKY